MFSGYLSNSFSRSGRLQRAASADVLYSPGQETGSATLGSTKQVQRPVFKEFDIPELKEVEIPGPRSSVPTLKQSSVKEPEKMAEQSSKAAPPGDSGRDSVADSGLGSVSRKKRWQQPDVRA